MEYRLLGKSGLKVSTITLGTMTFGGLGNFAKVGNVDIELARGIIDLCIDCGVNLIDTANIYSSGLSEEIIGEVLKGKRPGSVMISTKSRMPVGSGPNDEGFSRYHIIQECEKSLKRLCTDVIDIYYMHEWDGLTPLEEMLEALDSLVKAGKIRYIGCSNFSGWHTMKALAVSKENGYQRFVTQQIHYSLEAREAEYELLPIGVDQGLGALIWSWTIVRKIFKRKRNTVRYPFFRRLE
jgi:aryl-alcohol dehydrogenase-like predicted oxidoreductase